MKQLKILIIFIYLCLFIGGCKSNSIDEAFRKQSPNKNYELLYINQVDEKKIGLFKAPFDNGNIGIGVAIFEGNDKDGWKVIDSSSYYSPTKVIISRLIEFI
ncbi:hypothetical protein ACFQZT_28540 [Paenibacillus sp. GCM10027628]|uniref:hypothetical protein n=1 Tax=Paenibacillus sp. GCM10027628 TaxID=3273413 RepID=UPI0036363B58